MYDKNAMTTKIQSHHEGTKDTKVGKLMAENFVIFVSFVVKSVFPYHTKNHFRRRLAIATFVIACCLTTAASGQDKKLPAMTIAYSAISGSFAPLWVAHDLGLFAKHGLRRQDRLHPGQSRHALGAHRR